MDHLSWPDAFFGASGCLAFVALTLVAHSRQLLALIILVCTTYLHNALLPVVYSALGINRNPSILLVF